MRVFQSSLKRIRRALQQAATAELREAGSGFSHVDRAMKIVAAGQRYLDLQGRAALLKKLGMLKHGRRYSAANALPLAVAFGTDAPTFEEATEDLLRRVPMLVPAGQTTSDVYGKQHAFALARSSHREITAHVQSAVARASQGIATSQGVKSINAAAAEQILNLLLSGKISEGDAAYSLRGWSDAYAETVLRTNLATGHSAGQWRELAQPHIKKIIPALRYDATNDGDTRPNHEAIDGLILPVDHEWWDIYSPPNGFNCRCDLIYLDINTLRRMGLLDAAGRVAPRIPATVTGSPSGEGYPDVTRSKRSGKVWRFDQGRADRALYGWGL